jgi:archaeosine-15-forming tRNA-guanine transglycosylase
MKSTLTDTPQRGQLIHFDDQKLINVKTNGWFMLNKESGFVLCKKTNGRYWRIINHISNVENFYPKGGK